MKYSVSALLVVSLASTASAQSVMEFLPATPWQVNYDEQACDLRRLFEHDGKQILLQIRSYGQAGGTQQFILASEDIGLSPKPVTMQLFPGEEELTPVSDFTVTLGDGYEGKLFDISKDFNFPAVKSAYLAFLQDTPAIDDAQRRYLLRMNSEESAKIRNSERYSDANMAASSIVGYFFRKSDAYKAALTQSLASVESLRFKGVFVGNIALKTGSMVPPVKAMDDCIDDLQRYWGIDVEVQKTLTRPVAIVGYADFLKKMVNSYPSNMVFQGQQAVAPVRVNVSAEGRPTECHPLSASANPAFNAVVCDTFMRHAAFTPALDAAGVPVASFYTTLVSFSLS